MVLYLGFQDEQVQNEVSWGENQIGGKMIPMPLMKISKLVCKLCFSSLFHVLQIYCPLTDSLYHRTLNIFICLNISCTNKSESMIVLRSQFMEKQQKKVAHVTSVISTDDWGVNDWGTDDWNDEDNSSKDKIDTHQSNIENACQVDECNVSAANGVTDTMKYDNISADLAQHFNHKLNLDYAQEIFCGFYVYVLSEADVIAERSVEYEMKLYEEYITREGDVASITEKGLGNEKYVKTKAKHGDDAFSNFKKTVSKAPQQILRYEWNGKPLIYTNLSPPSTPFNEVPNCSICNSRRVFELQLMPHLISCLQRKNGYSVVDALDFGCIYVYSCETGCWEDGRIYPVEEFVVTQADDSVSSKTFT